MNHDNFSALRAYATTPEFYGPQATISMAEASLLTPTSPESLKSSKEDDKRPTKKRKSWGQELPTPKTNLPPRKRAKTDDEKEQRRIERVLRNRQAAQSSRERKRQEVEKLEGEKYAIERQNYMLKQRLLSVEHEKFALRQQLAKMAAALQKTGATPGAASVAPNLSSPPSPNLLAAEMRQIDKSIKQEFEDLSFSLPSPQDTLDPRSSFSSASPSSSRSSSPIDMDFNNGTVNSSDMTQHPAVMLCGLQCQSEVTWQPLPSPGSAPDEAQSQLLQQRQMHIQHTLTTLHLFLTLHSAVFSTLLQPLSLLLISLKTGLPMRPSKMTPSLFHLILWLISTPANPLTSITPTITSSPLTSMTNTIKTTSISSPPHHPPLAFRISLLRRLLACSPALARPLKDATGRALQMKTSHALRRKSDSRSAEGSAVEGFNGCGSDTIRSMDDARSRQEIWKLMTMALVIDQFRTNRKHSKKTIKTKKTKKRSDKS